MHSVQRKRAIEQVRPKAAPTRPSSGIKVVLEAVGSCSGLLLHKLCLNAYRHDVCGADRSCRKADDV